MKHRGKILSFIVLILSIVTVVRVEAYVFSDAYQLVSKVDFNQNNDFEYRAQIFKATEGYWIVDPEALIFVDINGKMRWKKPLASQNVEVANGSNKLLICEKKAGDLFVVHSSGKIEAQVTGIGELNDVRFFGDQFAAVLKKSGELLLFDSQLKLVSTSVLPAGEVVDFKLTPDQQNIIVGLLDLKNKVYNSKLVFIAKNGNVISGTNLNGLFLYAFNVYEDSIIAVTDEAIVKFGFDGTLKDEIKLEDHIRQFAFHPKNKNIFVQVFNDTVDLTNPKMGKQMVQYDHMGEKTVLFEPPVEFTKGIEVIGDKFIVYDESQWMILDEKGNTLFSQLAVEAIQKIHVLDEKSYAVEYINRLDVYKRK